MKNKGIRLKHRTNICR